jgi:D-alanine-D-alanine ligase
MPHQSAKRIRQAKPVVLHLCGSTASEYYEGTSLVYATQCMEEALKHDTYTNVLCRVHLDDTWSFPEGISEAMLSSAERLSFEEAITKIKRLQPEAVVPHMFCLPGMTTYRALCDLLNIPLIGNTADVMAISTNKWQTRAVVASMGVIVPEAEKITEGQEPKMQPPFLVKPCNEDNSQGINLVRQGDDVQKALDEAFKFDYELLVERYVPLGRELRVAVLEMDDGSFDMLPCIEYFLTEADPIRTAAHKLVTNAQGVPVTQATGGRKCPADIDDTLAAKLKNMAIRSHKALGCRDYSLYDVRVDPQGEPYFIEACLYCSFSSKSVIVAMAAARGIEQKTVYEMLVNRAMQRKKDAKTKSVLGMRAK